MSLEGLVFSLLVSLAEWTLLPLQELAAKQLASVFKGHAVN